MAYKKSKNSTQFAHHMIKEIFEQPEIIQNLIAEHINTGQKRIIFKQLSGRVKKIKKINRILILGCGSSYHAGIIGKYLLEEYSRIDAEVEFADEFISRQTVIGADTLVIAISQSGKTGDVLKAVRLAKKQKGWIMAITNAMDSPLDKLSDFTVLTQAGEEKALAATKTFTSQALILILFSAYLGKTLRRIKATVYKRIIADFQRLPAKADKLLKQNINLQILANQYYKQDNFLILGKNYQYPLGLEAALKLKEATYIHAEAFAAGEFAHGPLAVSGRKTPFIIFAPIGGDYKNLKFLIKKIYKLKRKIIIITQQGNRQLIRYADSSIYIPKTLNIFFPVLAIIAVQMLVYHISALKGINPDKPRNLKKFVI